MPNITTIMATMIVIMAIYTLLWFNGYTDGFTRHPQRIATEVQTAKPVRQQSIKFTAADDMYAEAVVKEMTNE